MESKKRKFWTPKPKKRNEVTQLKDRLSENVISNELSLDEVAMIIVAKHGLQTVLLLHAACDHVPSGFPNRTEYIQQILFDKGISKEDLSVYVNKHPTTSTFVVPSSNISAQLHKASEHFSKSQCIVSSYRTWIVVLFALDVCTERNLDTLPSLLFKDPSQAWNLSSNAESAMPDITWICTMRCLVQNCTTQTVEI